MKAIIFVAVALAGSASARVLEERQRPTGRPTRGPGGGPSGPPDVSQCGLDAFVGHTSEALLFCSSLLKSGTAYTTATVTAGTTTTVQTTVYTTLFPPTSTPKPPTSTPKPPTSTPKPPTSTPKPPTSTPPTSTPVTPSSSPSPTPSSGCGIVGYTKDTAAYYFDSSGTKNTWATCSAACKADSKCKSYAYGEANCMLFDVPAAGNTNYNPMSPYTFYDVSCPSELPVRKRQINISLGLPGGTPAITSACSCLITSGPADATRTTSVTVRNTFTATQTVTKTLSVLPGM